MHLPDPAHGNNANRNFDPAAYLGSWAPQQHGSSSSAGDAELTNYPLWGWSPRRTFAHWWWISAGSRNLVVMAWWNRHTV